MSKVRHPLLLVFVLSAICLLPTMAMRDFSPDNELRYLSIADEAISEGNVFAFTLNGVPYADKPPLYLWIVMLSRLIFGKHSMFFLSLFSLIPAFVTIGVMDSWMGRKEPLERIALAFMMMTSVLFLGLSVFLRMDMLMCMFIVLALFTFYRMYEGEGNRKRQEIMLPVWIFLALFTKGPVGVMMPPLVIIVFLLVRRKGREIGSYLGWKTWGILAALCAVWFTGVYLDGGKDYLNNLLFHQTVGRAVNSFHHKNPFWYYFGTVWYVTAPWCILLAGSVAASLAARGKDRSDKEIFFSVSVVSTTLMLSCFSAKLAIYFTPVMPFMVMLFAEVLARTGWKKWMTWGLTAVWGILVLALVAALAAMVFAREYAPVALALASFSFITDHLVLFGIVTMTLGLVLAIVQLWCGKPDMAIVTGAAAILLMGYSASSSMPRINDWIGYGNVCATVPEGKDVTTIFVRRSVNMKVYLGREVTDYEKDLDKFKKEVMEPCLRGERHLVVITAEDKLSKDEDFEDFILEANHWHVGPWCVASF